MNDNDLNSARTDLRDKSIDYDCYAIPFIAGQRSKHDLIKIMNLFPYFSQEIQAQIADQLFSIDFIGESNAKMNGLFLNAIECLINDNFFSSADTYNRMINLLCCIFIPNLTIEIQQKIIDIFSQYLFIHNKFKKPELYNIIQSVIQNFGSVIDLLPLFISIVETPPFPPKELAEIMTNLINSNFIKQQNIPQMFHFFALCAKNNLDISFDPFLQKIPSFLYNNDKKIYYAFIDFLLSWPEAKPEFLPLLLQIENSSNSIKLKTKIFRLFINRKYIDIWKQTSSQEIIQCACKYLQSEHTNLKSLSIFIYINYQPLSSIPFNDDLARLLLDNFEIPYLTVSVTFLLIHWITDNSMDNDTKKKLYKLIIDDYDNLKLVINMSLDENSNMNQLYIYLDSVLDIIYSYDLAENIS